MTLTGSMHPPPPPDGIYVKKEESDANSVSSMASSMNPLDKGFSSSSSSSSSAAPPPPANCVSTYRSHPTKYEVEPEPAAFVIYIVDPFNYQRDWTPDHQRLATIGLLRYGFQRFLIRVLIRKTMFVFGGHCSVV